MYVRMIKRRMASIAAAMVFLMMFSGCGNFGKENDYVTISQREAKEIMDSKKGIVILDARSEEEFADGHIPGAVVIPHTEISEKAESEIPDKKAVILVYCRSGRRSKLAAEELINLGYENVYEFGGINSWPYEIVK